MSSMSLPMSIDLWASCFSRLIANFILTERSQYFARVSSFAGVTKVLTGSSVGFFTGLFRGRSILARTLAFRRLDSLRTSRTEYTP
jgi:hypothetical protein